MKSQRSRAKPRPKTSAEIAEMIGTGRVLDAAIRRAVRRTIEATQLRRKLKDPAVLLAKARPQRALGRRTTR